MNDDQIIGWIIGTIVGSSLGTFLVCWFGWRLLLAQQDRELERLNNYITDLCDM